MSNNFTISTTYIKGSYKDLEAMENDMNYPISEYEQKNGLRECRQLTVYKS